MTQFRGPAFLQRKPATADAKGPTYFRPPDETKPPRFRLKDFGPIAAELEKSDFGGLTDPKGLQSLYTWFKETFEDEATELAIQAELGASEWESFMPGAYHKLKEKLNA